MQKAIVELFERTFGSAPERVVPVAADGSQRMYFRLFGGPLGTVVGAHGPDRDENRAFLSFSATFRELGLPVPLVHAADEDRGVWLLEDLGDSTLFAELSRARAAGGGDFPASARVLYERVVETLPRFQVEGGRAVDFSVAYPRSAFDEQSMMWDLNYFKYHFLKLAHIPFHEQRLENDFRRLIDFLLQADCTHFLYRDFQSRNVMVRDGQPWFIDYQGGRRGALHYDLAALLYDAKAAVPDMVREELLDRYLTALSEHLPVDRERFGELYRGYVIIRIMQAMGAYGYRGYFERKSRFLQSVPYAARNIAGLLEQGLPVRLPEIEAVFGRIVEVWAEGAPSDGSEGLNVHLSSFSYRRGYPEDDRGHGGGFVFDCRSLPNPGRSPEYAGVTGLDPGVIAFLEADREVADFRDRVRGLVDAHVESYRRRGFTDLSVAFGCTGGQHRSVYFAELIARHLRERHPDVRVHLEHRERGGWPRPAGHSTELGGAVSDNERTPASDHEPPSHATDQGEEVPWTG